MAKKAKRPQYPEQNPTRSATETTGGIPSLPQNEEEYESYQDTINMATPKKKKRK